MTDITISLDWSEVPVDEIQRELVKRHLGNWPGITSFAITLATFAVTLAYLQIRVPAPMSGQFWAMIAIILVGAALLFGSSTYFNKRLMTAVRNAPIRQIPSDICLTHAGITVPGAMIAGTLEWDKVTDVVERQDAVLLLFSPIEFVPLLDKNLPADVSRGDLVAQIQTWRA